MRTLALVRLALVFGCWLGLAVLCHAQPASSALARPVRLSQPRGTLSSILAEISQQAHFTFVYSDDVVTAATLVQAPAGPQTVQRILDAVLTANGLTYTLLDQQIIIRKKPAASKASGKITLSGYVRDAATGENLIGVSVVHPATGQGTATNTYGFYSLTLSAPEDDSLRVLVSYVGYAPGRWASATPTTGRRDFHLRAVSNELQGVEVVGTHAEQLVQSTRMGTIQVPVAQIKALPKLFGETDVLKVLQLLPGVQSGGEGSAGLYVRGGSLDQNLILLDGTPVYNATHLFGFFSVFNADALNHVELVKGGFPARYGGRLSSVLDMSMKEGNMQAFHGEGAIGLLASRVTLEGPIKKDTASFIFSARRTYIDVLARPLIKAVESNDNVPGYYFYDLNGKLNWKIGTCDRLYLSAYTGHDKFYSRYRYSYGKSESKLGWGNLTTALRWNHVLTNRLFVNTHVTYSKYQFDVGTEEESRLPTTTDTYSLRYLSNIQDVSVKTDFEFIPNPNHYFRFGSQYIRHQFRPGAFQERGTAGTLETRAQTSPRTRAHEASVYAEDDYHVTERLKVNAGLRLNSFWVDSKVYPSLEPRLAARYLLTEAWALKAAYARTTQYIHLLTNSGIGLPTDLWVPATARVKPQRAQQVSLGVVRSLRFRGEDYELSLETYYKPMRNLIEYLEGASFVGIGDQGWEDKVTSGDGWAYGGEFFLHKKTGRTTGWIGYTLAWSQRRFPDLNQGRLFPYKYDRRHDISLVVLHKFTDHLTLSGTWVYGTGNAVTLSRGRYELSNDETVDNYSSRNGYRMAAYHRLDLDLSKTKKKKWGEVVNSVSLYNAYSRRNPYFLYLRDDKFRQVSLFPILPSVSKSFKF